MLLTDYLGEEDNDTVIVGDQVFNNEYFGQIIRDRDPQDRAHQGNPAHVRISNRKDPEYSCGEGNLKLKTYTSDISPYIIELYCSLGEDNNP